MRRVLPLVLVLAGCAGPAHPPASGLPPLAARLPAPALPAAVADPDLQPSPWPVLGSVLAVDAARHTAIVDVSPLAALPADLNRRQLLARNPGDLRPTARLQATPYLRGLTLGTQLLEGTPALGDEVVLLPPVAPSPPPAQ